MAATTQNEDLLRVIFDAADKHGLDPNMAMAVASVESAFNPKAVSSAGAQGLMQLMPETAESLGVKNAFDPAENADGGVRYFKQMLDKFGSPLLAAAAYNAGPGNVSKYKGVPPFKETQNYVKKIQDAYNYFSGKFAPGTGTQVVDPSKVKDLITNSVSSSAADDVPFQALVAKSLNIDPSVFLQDIPKKSTSEKIMEATSALAGIAGSVANVAGAFKGTGQPGNALLQSQQLQGILSGNRKKELEKKQAANDFYSNQGIPADLRVAAGLAQQGIPTSAVLQATGYGPSINPADLIKDQLDIVRKKQVIDANTPEALAAKEAASFDKAAGLYEAREDAKVKVAEERINKLRSKLDDSVAKNALGDSRLYASQLRKLTGYAPVMMEPSISGKLIKEKEKLEQINSVSRDLQTLTSALDRFQTGPIAGRAASIEASLTGEGPILAYQQMRAFLSTPVARGIIGEKGVITDKDREFALQSLENPNMTPKQRKEILSQFMTKLNAEKEAKLKLMDAIAVDPEDYTYKQFRASLAGPAQKLEVPQTLLQNKSGLEEEMRKRGMIP